MIQNLEQLKQILANTVLAETELKVKKIDDSDKQAYLIHLPQDIEPLQAWRILYDRQDLTAHYPILIDDEIVTYDDIFDRYEFDAELKSTEEKNSALKIIQSAQHVKVESLLRDMNQNSNTDLKEYIDFECDYCLAEYSKKPDIKNIDQFMIENNIQNIRDVELWFLNWEKENIESQQLDCIEHYQDWYSPDQNIILLIPCTQGEDILAYLHFYGVSVGLTTSENLIALLKYWREQYNVKIVAYYGTMLQFILPKPIESFDTALDIALQHYAIAPCTTLISGVTVRQHAKNILKLKRWFLHERP